MSLFCRLFHLLRRLEFQLQRLTIWCGNRLNGEGFLAWLVICIFLVLHWLLLELLIFGQVLSLFRVLFFVGDCFYNVFL